MDCLYFLLLLQFYIIYIIANIIIVTGATKLQNSLYVNGPMVTRKTALFLTSKKMCVISYSVIIFGSTASKWLFTVVNGFINLPSVYLSFGSSVVCTYLAISLTHGYNCKCKWSHSFHIAIGGHHCASTKVFYWRRR